MAEPDVRKGMPPVKLPRTQFEKRYRSRFVDPAFRPLQRELDAIVAAARDACSHSRKAPHTRKAGPGFADPEYEISVDCLATREAILEAQRRWRRNTAGRFIPANPASPPRCRSATGRAVAIRTIRSARPTTG
jgi:hypothetical protein